MGQRVRHGVWPVLALLAPMLAVAADPEPARVDFFDPNAVLVNLTESDLNRILEDAFRAAGGPNFAGTRERVSSTMSGLHYAARFSEPVVDLGPDGAARLSFELEQADLRVDRVEGKLIGTAVRCEGIGARLEPDRALGVALDLKLVIEDGDVRIVPQDAAVTDAARAFRLTKPTCHSSLFPTFLLWWVGKPRLQKQLGELDEMLLASVRRSAADLSAREDGLLHKRVPVGDQDLFVAPRALETGHDSIWIAAIGTSGGETPNGNTDPPAALGPSRPGSWLAVSERMANAILAVAYRDWSRPAARPHGTLRKVFQSHAVLALVPGLRNVRDREDLTWGVSFHAVPRVEFRTEGGRPLIELQLSGIELDIGRGEEVLGTLEIERGTVGAVPVASPLGGITLEVVRNEWKVSSRGLAFDEPLLAGTIQELIFGELFETRYEPLARGALTVGDTRFEPTGIEVVEGYLVIPFASRAPRRTDNPLASR